jgi:ABC-type oligopeptide transport system substrate-binding subunit/tRNA A-37 threonylcarbamoyl transferase component Bud32/tetratricopeptide (TPR) repeat protein
MPHRIVRKASVIGKTLLERYHLDAELGRGGMGVVYQAHDKLLKRSIAVKVLSDAHLDPEGRARLLREAKAVARLNHPNIVTIYDVGEADGVLFIVMEMVEGQPLNKLQSENLNCKIAIVRQICAALEHAHTRGIIHRDLKPENIYILACPDSGDGSGVRVKLMDFGLAYVADTRSISERGAIVGTLLYIAPEIIRGQVASPQSDLYALGVILYELFAGQPPFAGDNLMVIASQHLYAPVVPPSTYNSDILHVLDNLIGKLLSKQPEDRPTSAAELSRALEQISWDSSVPEAQTAVEQLPLLERIARGRFVARRQEVAVALDIWQQAMHGEGHVLLVSGEPGIGKTRFVCELMVNAQLTGSTVLLGECFSEGSAPYAPVAQLIASTDLTGMPPSIVADLMAVVPALRANYPGIPANPLLEPQAERQRIFDNVAAFFALLSERAPVLLFIDDVHWADSGSLFLLHHLARRGRTLRMLIVLTYREVELIEARPLYQTLLDFSRERLATLLTLPRFDRDQTCELLAALFQEEITPEFLDSIYSETDGNPFFIEEVCKALIESGSLYREGGKWRRPGMDQIVIPQTVRLAIELRLAKLPPEVQDTLRAAAVLGREFEFEVLRGMDSLDEETLIDALEIAERAQFVGEISRASTPSFTFVHALIPLTLQDGLNVLRRQQLHRLAAQAIEHVHADQLPTGDFAAALGRHYAEAGDTEKAADHYMQAAERAHSVYAYQEAIDHYRHALAFLKEQGTMGLARAARTTMTLGQLYSTVFDFEHSQQAYQEGFTLWLRDEEEQRRVVWPPAPHALRLLTNAVWCLDLTATNETTCYRIIQQMFSGLVEATAEYDIVPALARTWDIFDNGRRYVFHLRPDARWSDGHPVSAHDFEFAWKYQLDPANASLNSEYFFDIKNARAFHEGRAACDDIGVRATDDLTLLVELEEPVGHFLQLLAYISTYAIPRHTYEAHGSQWASPANIITNGPFCLETWRPGECIVLRRNPDYTGRTSGNVSRVELTLPSHWNGNEILKAYEADTIDVLSIGPGLTGSWQDAEKALQRYACEYREVLCADTWFVHFQTKLPPFDDVRVRKAFSHAIDRVRMADEIYGNFTMPALGGFVPPSLPGHTPEIGLSYDPGCARQLLAEAGYPDGHGFPEIEAYDVRSKPVLSQYLQWQWKDVLGIEFQYTRMPMEEFYEQRLWQKTHLMVNSWRPDYPDPHNFLSLATHYFALEWCNAEYEHLLEMARRSTDLTERIRTYQVAERILINEAAIIPVAYAKGHQLVKPWVKNYPKKSFIGPLWKDVIIEPH